MSVKVTFHTGVAIHISPVRVAACIPVRATAGWFYPAVSRVRIFILFDIEQQRLSLRGPQLQSHFMSPHYFDLSQDLPSPTNQRCVYIRRRQTGDPPSRLRAHPVPFGPPRGPILYCCYFAHREKEAGDHLAASHSLGCPNFTLRYVVAPGEVPG
jgi:hypothetical protein